MYVSTSNSGRNLFKLILHVFYINDTVLSQHMKLYSINKKIIINECEMSNGDFIN